MKILHVVQRWKEQGFTGFQNHHPAAVFKTREQALDWIEQEKLDSNLRCDYSVNEIRFYDTENFS